MHASLHPPKRKILKVGKKVYWSKKAKEELKISTLFLGEGPFTILSIKSSLHGPKYRTVLIDVKRPQGARYDWYCSRWFALA